MFEFRRFRRLAAATWNENRRAWAWFIAIGIVVHCLLCLALLVPKHGYQALSVGGQEAIFLFGGYLSGLIFAGRYFAAMARRGPALVLLMRPASTFEKWLLALLVVAIGYPLAYTLAFQVCNIPAGLLAEAMAQAADETARNHAHRGEFLERFGVLRPWQAVDTGAQWTVLLLVLTTLQAFAVLGSLYFRSFPFIKTILAGFLLLLALMLLVPLGGGNPGLFFGYWEGNHALHAWQRLYFPVAWVAVPLLTWLACLAALREREVA